MPNEIQLKSFPSTTIEALAYLYLQNQNLGGKSPSEIQTMYYEAYYELIRDYKEKRDSNWLTEQRDMK